MEAHANEQPFAGGRTDGQTDPPFGLDERRQLPQRLIHLAHQRPWVSFLLLLFLACSGVCGRQEPSNGEIITSLSVHNHPEPSRALCLSRLLLLLRRLPGLPRHDVVVGPGAGADAAVVLLG